MLVLGLNSKDRKSTGDKENISNPKINRDCAPLTANRFSADCVQISPGLSIPYIPLGPTILGDSTLWSGYGCGCVGWGCGVRGDGGCGV